MTTSQLSTILTIIATGIGIGVVIWRAVHSVAKKYADRYLTPVMQVIEDFRGDPGRPDDGIPARDGVLKRLTRVETGTADVRSDLNEFRTALAQVKDDILTIKAQVTTNGGSSMLDRVTQTLDAVNSQNAHATPTIGATP